MAESFFNGTDAQVYTASRGFSAKISATPGAFGLDAGQAAAYAALNSAYASAYLEAVDPETRTRGKVSAKNRAKADLKAMASSLAKVINGTPTVTDEQKIDLGLNVRKKRTPIATPADAPNVMILFRVGTMVRIKLHDGTGRRARPDGVAGASVFTHVGPTPPASRGEWTFETNTAKTTLDVHFDATLPAGTIVWFSCSWYNPSGKSGAGCPPVNAILAGGGMLMAA